MAILFGGVASVAFSGVAGTPSQVAGYLLALGAMMILLLLVLRLFGIRPPG